MLGFRHLSCVRVPSPPKWISAGWVFQGPPRHHHPVTKTEGGGKKGRVKQRLGDQNLRCLTPKMRNIGSELVWLKRGMRKKRPWPGTRATHTVWLFSLFLFLFLSLSSLFPTAIFGGIGMYVEDVHHDLMKRCVANKDQAVRSMDG